MQLEEASKLATPPRKENPRLLGVAFSPFLTKRLLYSDQIPVFFRFSIFCFGGCCITCTSSCQTSGRWDQRSHYAPTGASFDHTGASNFVIQCAPTLGSCEFYEFYKLKELRKNWQPTLPMISTTCSLV